MTRASGTKTFRPKARILRTLGDELISSEVVALLEVVKNSYDADATKVLIRFHEPLTIGAGKIEVVDNGHGMSLETIQTTWMEPATPLRKQEPRSRMLNRRVLGHKGIGRFATSRLANSLEVITCPTDSDRQTRVYFDWTQFDDDETYLDEVQVLWEDESRTAVAPGGAIHQLWASTTTLPPTNCISGTILCMEQLRTSWSAQQFQDLRNGLSRLVSPFFESELEKIGDHFDISLELPPNFQEQSGIIQPTEILRNPHYIIRGNIEGNGQYNLTIGLRDSDDQETIYGQFKPDNREPRCGSVGIELRIWDRDASSMAELARRHVLESTTIARQALNTAAGISVYRDGFRVLPYGEPQNDWLRLDMRRVQNPTLRLSNNQILGYVLISSETNPQLRDQSNREGMIEGPHLDDLRELIRFVLSEIETRRFRLRHQTTNRRRNRAGGLLVDLNIDSVRIYAAGKHPDDHQLTRVITETEKDLDDRAEAIQEVLSRYHSLAFLGGMIDRLLHDGRTPLAKIVNEATIGLMDINSPQQEDQAAAQGSKQAFITILSQSDTLSELFRKLEPFGGKKRGRPRAIALERIIADAFSVLDTEIAEVGATAELPNTDTTVTVDPVDIQRVIINLLRNSLYWLKQVPPEDRRVAVKVARQGPSEVEVLFSDSGPGVSPEARDLIFQPYFSTKPEGVGLGLLMTGEIVTDYYGGVLELLDNGPLPGASFRFTLCRRV